MLLADFVDFSEPDGLLAKSVKFSEPDELLADSVDFAEPEGLEGLLVDSVGSAPGTSPALNAPSELGASCGFCSAAWDAHTGLASGVFCCAALAKDVGAVVNAANPPPLLLPLPKAEVGGGLTGVAVAPKDVLPNADCPNAGLLAGVVEVVDAEETANDDPPNTLPALGEVPNADLGLGCSCASFGLSSLASTARTGFSSLGGDFGAGTVLNALGPAVAKLANPPPNGVVVAGLEGVATGFKGVVAGVDD